MAPYQPAPKVAASEIRFRWNEVPVEYSLHFEHTTGITQGNLDNLSLNLWGFAEEALLNTMNYSCLLTEVYSVDLTTQDGVFSSYTGDGPVPGARSGFSAANCISCCMSLRTTKRGKSGRGRIYTVGMERGDHTPTTVVDTYIATLTGVYNQMKGLNAIAPGWTLVVLSRQTNNTTRPQGVPTPVTSVISTDNGIDVQRGRLK